MNQVAPKCVKPAGKTADELEKQVSQALFDLESSSDIKQQLRELYFVQAKVIHFVILKMQDHN